MALNSVTEFFDDVYNASWNNIRPGFIQEAFEATPFYFEVLQKQRKRHEGGKRFDVPIMFGGNTSKKWLSGKTDTVSLDEDEKSTDANYFMKTLAINISRYKDEELAAFGNKDARNRLVELKLGDAKASMIDEMEDVAASDGSQDSNATPGIPEYIREDPTSSTTVAGLNQSTNTWWQNKIKDLTGVSPVGNLYREMRILYKECGKKAPGIKGSSRFPDIGFGGQDAHTFYEDEVDDRTTNYRYTAEKNVAGALGFDNVHFKTMTIWWSPAFNDQHLYLMNSNFIEFRVHPMDEFMMTEWKTEAAKPRARYAQITLTCAITFLSRSRQGLIFNIGN